MSRGQIVVLAVFAAIVTAIAIFALPLLMGPERPPPPTDVSESDALSGPAAVATPRQSPTGARANAESRTLLDIVVTTRSDSAPIDVAAARLVGAEVYLDAAHPSRAPNEAQVRRTAPSAWVGAPGMRWAPLPPRSDRGRVVVALEPAGPPVTIVVSEDDGKPAADVPVLWAGPDGKPMALRTDAVGHVAIDDQPVGLVIVSVGGTERAGPTLRLRVGTDHEAHATLDPPLVVTGRVLDAIGGPVAGARVRGLVPGGRAGADVPSDAMGAFRWHGGATDRLVLVAATSDGRSVAVEPRWPDPRGPLATAVELPLPAAASSIELRLPPFSGAPVVFAAVEAEPSALALVREAFGPDSAAYERFATYESATATGVGFDGPVRVQVGGDAVPEDHLVPAASNGRPRRVDLAPRAAVAPKLPASAAIDPTKAPKGTITARVRDVGGVALAGVTVTAGDKRVVTDKEGRFTITGLVPGDRVDLVYGWLDDADTGPVDPAPFAPWFSASVKASAPPPAPPSEPIELVLPRAASVTFRATNGIDGKPLSWVRVLVLDGAGEARFDDVVATRDGRVRLDGIVAGTAGSLLVFAPGLRREVPLALRAGETVDVGEVPLVRGGRIEGSVRGPGGAPIAGAVVAAVDDGRGDAGGRALARERDRFLRRTTTGPGGQFVLDGLDETKPAVVAVYAQGFAPSVHPVAWDADGTAKYAAKLVVGATLRVRVEDSAGRALVGAAVELRDARSGVRWLDLVRAAGLGGVVGSTDDIRLATAALLTEDPARPGLHRVGPVEPGPYEVIVLRPGYKPSRTKTTVAPSVAGAIDNPLGLPIGGMDLRVTLEPLADEPR
jgi:hypothetical protein